jgi:RNA polymerase sigma factor (sigma-70 family)
MLGKHKGTVDLDSIFWQKWQEYQDYLYGCCLKRMGGNQPEAEDVLSAAMLKAREGWRKSTEPIDNGKTWLARVVNNVCADFLKRRDRFVLGIEDERWVSREETPVLAATRQELELFFEGEANSLSPKLGETLLLHWKEELSYEEIAERLGISRDNVRKRVSNARATLRERWREYDRAVESSRPWLKTPKESKGSRLATPAETEMLASSESLVADDVGNLAADGAKVEAPRTDAVAWVKDGRPVEAPSSQPRLEAKLPSWKLALVRANPVRAILANAKLSLPIKNREEKQGDTLKGHLGTYWLHPPGKLQWGVLGIFLRLLLLLLPESFVLAWRIWADSGGRSLLEISSK